MCRRAGSSLGAGLDVRHVLKRESEIGRPYHRRQVAKVRDQVEVGETMPDAVATTGNYFPPFFREMVKIGDATGRMEYVLGKLADYYEHLVNLRRAFLIGISWPMLQLAGAITVIGLLILALGWVADMTGQETDLLGGGLVGLPGFIRYCVGLGLIATVAMFAWQIANQPGVRDRVLYVLMSLPAVGTNLQTLALSRMAWALGMAIDTGAAASKSMELAINSTASDYFIRHLPQIQESLKRGDEMHVALRQTGVFPDEFLVALQVGEESGRVTESLIKLAENYQQQAKASMSGLTLAATILVWSCVAAVLIIFIFRLFSFYAQTLDPANYGL